ncbi:MAG TPA: phosphate ABC transporter permease subunit PstC [Candidatus Binataceae bacterium]|nr:phosphate ABC transporter permease subunit PstC [Candidatus Binataceae bacterium]
MAPHASIERHEYPALVTETQVRRGVAARTNARNSLMRRCFPLMVGSATGIFVLIIAALFVELLVNSLPSIRQFGPGFLWSSEWNPVTERFGALPFIYGTIVSSLIALAIAAWIGILGAAFLAEFSPRYLATPLGFIIELLAAVPSVVYGLWGLFCLAPAMQHYIEPALQRYLGFLPIFSGPAYGVGLLTAALILALMIVPTVIAISRDLLQAVPAEMREALLALGATRWDTFKMVVLPYARAGIFGACILALGRALGETIATTMVIGNRPAISLSLLAPSYTLSSVIANEFTEATTRLYLSALIELGLVLFLISVLVNSLARLLMRAVFGTVVRP